MKKISMAARFKRTVMNIAAGLFPFRVSVQIIDPQRSQELGFSTMEKVNGKIKAKVWLNPQHPYFCTGNSMDGFVGAMGVATHEFAHIKLTNFDLFKKQVKDADPRIRILFRNMFNIFEDSRIEARIYTFAGSLCRKSILYTNKVVWDNSMPIDQGYFDPVSQIMNALIQYGDQGKIKGSFSDPDIEADFLHMADLHDQAVAADDCETCLNLSKQAAQYIFDKYYDDVDSSYFTNPINGYDNECCGKGEDSSADPSDSRQKARQKTKQQMKQNQQQKQNGKSGQNGQQSSADGKQSSGSNSSENSKGDTKEDGNQKDETGSSASGGDKQEDSGNESENGLGEGGSNKDSGNDTESESGSGSNGNGSSGSVNNNSDSESDENDGIAKDPDPENTPPHASSNNNHPERSTESDENDDEASENDANDDDDEEDDELNLDEIEDLLQEAMDEAQEQMEKELVDDKTVRYSINDSEATTCDESVKASDEETIDLYDEFVAEHGIQARADELQSSLSLIFNTKKTGFKPATTGRINLKRYTDGRVRSDVFDKRREKTNDVSALFVGDCSGSMWDKMDETKSMIMELAIAFNGLKVPFAVIGHHGAYYGNTDLHIDIYKTFDDPRWTSLANMRPENYNFDGAAIKVATNMMRDRRERNRIMIVLTDGCSHDSRNCAAAIQAAHKVATTIIGVGLSLDDSDVKTMKYMYGEENCIFCTSMKELNPLLSEKLRRLAMNW